MNNLHLIIFIAVLISFVSCGQSEKAKESKAKQDSIVKVEKTRKSADSLYSIFEKEKKKQDSVKNQDSIANAARK